MLPSIVPKQLTTMLYQTSVCFNFLAFDLWHPDENYDVISVVIFILDTVDVFFFPEEKTLLFVSLGDGKSNILI